MKLLCRAGCAAKGLVYLLVGMRALRAAFEPIPPTGSKESMERWGEALGIPFLVLLALGLFSFALWRGLQTWSSPKGFWSRAGYALSGLLYFKVGKEALELVWERPDADDQRKQEHLAAFLFSQPLGQALVGLAGAVVIGTGLYQFWKAYHAKFSAQEGFNPATVWLARAGLASRGVAFLLLGSYMVRAAWTVVPSQVASLSEILNMLKHEGGLWALALMGVGLTAYGISMGIQACTYRPGQPAA